MAKARDPWLKFFPDDWRADVGLQLCDLAARGLWFEMLCLMHNAEPYGHLVEPGEENGTPMSQSTLAFSVRSDVKVVEPLLKQLESHGVFSRDPRGVVFSRRLVHDRHVRLARASAGQAGGRATQKAVLLKRSVQAKCGTSSGIGTSSETSSSEGESEGAERIETLWLRDAWNELAPPECPRCRDWTKTRRRRARQRLLEYPDPQVWRDAIGQMKDRPFLCGKNARGWKATIDWLLQPDSLTKTLEGQYAGKTGGGNARPTGAPMAEADLAGIPRSTEFPQPGDTSQKERTS